ncbi:hypothetical protein Kpol_472p3 [Vanderwaltozyma polyspora DSM 70294]|uniref:C2H2-type domain-containing protein n=1 Tax=Vanderwaltozyma polyspora (strain ATCC 22028 / DSM 70294 / BCRC 21397 / CBS 2163 / NBRC 10782 / NRRL Y-8283 / UCD 57-17) TaxID=436907 RepID=A7TQH1_VANPO|nr:uncharacterized protein Kpol_472p3 [Vanderwaltozyma polyspora DSM 70294]EDO15472.1 hypothetical protein Kpol_472p3 [Vanderwaltozyma polyspora DSM 70294]
MMLDITGVKMDQLPFIQLSSTGGFIRRQDRKPRSRNNLDLLTAESNIQDSLQDELKSKLLMENIPNSFENLIRVAENQFKNNNGPKIDLSSSAAIDSHLSDNLLFEKSTDGSASKQRKRRLPESSENRNPNARKKKQCPDCKLFFSNLTTHKRTHLAPEDKPFKCPSCNKGFSRNFDFLRHQKEHVQKDLLTAKDPLMSEHDRLVALHNTGDIFRCPYNEKLINIDLELYKHKFQPKTAYVKNCHSTGLFLRKDTLRNHLRAHHFNYADLTLPKRKSITSPGNCGACGKWFENTTTWTDEHVGKECGYKFH